MGEPLRFLALDASGERLFALGAEFLHEFGWDAASQTITTRGRRSAAVSGTHVELGFEESFAVVASYGGGSVALIPLEFSEPAHVLGGGEEGGYRKAHQVRNHAGSRTCHVPCLGEDRVAVLRLEAGAPRLLESGSGATPAGAGPRHMDYHPTLPVAYALNELQSSVTRFEVDPASGQLHPKETSTTLPPDFEESGSRSSDIHVSPDGRFLFAINREPLNDIVTFALDDAGHPTQVSRTSVGGDHARTFAIDPSGRWIYIACTKSRELNVFAVDDEGTLTRQPARWAASANLQCVLAR